MSKKSSMIAALLVCVSIYLIFILLFQQHTVAKEQEEVDGYARVIANSLWRLDPLSPSAYLRLIAARNGYRRLVITQNDGSVFLKITTNARNQLESTLISLGVMRQRIISSEVKYQGQTIGSLTAVWFSRAIYTYFWALIILLLVLTAFWLFIRTLDAKRYLKLRVSERTADLEITNRDLQKQIAERKQAEAALRESESRLRTVLISSPDPLVAYDTEGKVKFFNPAFTRVFGWTLEERKGKRMDDFVPEENWPETRAMINKVLAGGGFSGVETRRYTKDRRSIPVSLSGGVYRDDNGGIAGSVVNIRDISSQKRLEEEFRHSQKMEAIGTLSGGIAHDFNNILQAILGYLQLLLRSGSFEAKQLTHIDQIERACQRATNLVSRLMAFSRKGGPKFSAVDINGEIIQTVEILERTIPKMIHIVTRLSPDLNPIKADADQLAQVLMNLGANARDAMESGGQIIIETQSLTLEPGEKLMDLAPGDYVLIRFSDTGIGMPTRVREQIFDPFFTTKDVGKGTGLGLSTVYGIIKGHGGYITCDTQLGHGTTFNIYLPVLKESLEILPDEGAACPLTLGGQESILLVDDEKPLREVESEILSIHGYKVLEADSGERALEILRNNNGPVDLVVLDLGMPGMGGLECLRRIMEIDSTTKVLVASGYSGTAPRDAVMEAGAKAFIYKPFPLEALLARVREVLGPPPGR